MPAMRKRVVVVLGLRGGGGGRLGCFDFRARVVKACGGVSALKRTESGFA